MALDRTQVVKAAIDLLDEVGLDGLTLRRLGQELGVQAPALYWHFKNKQELLDQIVVYISTTEHPPRRPSEGQTWDDWLAQRARDLRAALTSHRDGAILAASTRPQPSRWADVEDQIGIFVDAGMTPADGLRALLTAEDYVSGFALEEQADRTRWSTADAREADTGDAEFEVLTAFADYPHLSAALRELGDPQGDRAFEAGLSVVLDGVRARAAAAATSAR